MRIGRRIGISAQTLRGQCIIELRQSCFRISELSQPRPFKQAGFLPAPAFWGDQIGVHRAVSVGPGEVQIAGFDRGSDMLKQEHRIERDREFSVSVVQCRSLASVEKPCRCIRADTSIGSLEMTNGRAQPSGAVSVFERDGPQDRAEPVLQILGPLFQKLMPALILPGGIPIGFQTLE